MGEVAGSDIDILEPRLGRCFLDSVGFWFGCRFWLLLLFLPFGGVGESGVADLSPTGAEVVGERGVAHFDEGAEELGGIDHEFSGFLVGEAGERDEAGQIEEFMISGFALTVLFGNEMFGGGGAGSEGFFGETFSSDEGGESTGFPAGAPWLVGEENQKALLFRRRFQRAQFLEIICEPFVVDLGHAGDPPHWLQ